MGLFNRRPLPPWVRSDIEMQELLLAAIATGQVSRKKVDELTGYQAGKAIERLRAAGCAQEPMLSGELVLSSAGRALAEQVSEAWESGPIRREIALLSVLHAVRGGAASATDITERAADPPFGQRLSSDEVAEAMRDAGEQGYLGGVMPTGSGEVFCVDVTAAGLRRLDQGLIVEEGTSEVTVSNFNTHIGTNFGNVAVGDSANQSGAWNVNLPEALRTVEEALVLARQLPDDGASEVVGYLQEAQRELGSRSPDLPNVKARLASAKGAILQLAGSAVVGNLLQLIDTASLFIG